VAPAVEGTDRGGYPTRAKTTGGAVREAVSSNSVGGVSPGPEWVVGGDAERDRARPRKEQAMEMTDPPRYVMATFVKAGRDGDFERFMREVVIPAESRVRPHQVGMWHLLRPADDQPEGATRAWLITFHGLSTLEDWTLQPLFDEAYGPDESLEHLKYFEDMVDGEQIVYAVDGEVAL
jgi:hypothetical protein